MKKVFDKNLYKESIKEILSRSIIMLILGLIITTLNYWFTKGYMIEFYGSTRAFNTTDIALFAVMILGSNVLARKLVSFAWSREKTDMLYSSPYSKGQIFFTKAFAAATMQTGVLILISVFGALLTFRHLGKIVFASDIAVTTLNMILGSLIIIGAVFFSIGITGSKTSSALVADWVMAAPAFMFIIRYFTIYYRNIRYNSYFMQKIDLYVISNMLMKAMGQYDATRYIPSAIFSVILAVLIFVVGYILFKKRGGELTGSFAKIKIVHLLAICFLPFVIVFITFMFLFTVKEINWDVIRLAVFFFALAAASVYLQERAINKKIEKNNRCIWAFLACVIAAFAIVYPAFLIAGRDESRQLSAEDVESVNIVTFGEYGSTYSSWYDAVYGGYLATDFSLQSPRTINKIVDLYSVKNEGFNGVHRQLVKINLKSGESIMVQVPNFVEWGSGCGNINTDLDDTLYSEDEYMSLLYAPMPAEYITHLFDSNLQGIENKQEGLLDVYMLLTEEFAALSYDTKRELTNGIGASWSMEYINIAANYKDDCIIPVGFIHVRGRVGSTDMINQYKLTAYTPKASNAYMKLIFNENIEAYKEFIEIYKNNPIKENYPYDVTLYYMGDDGQLKIETIKYHATGLFENEYRQSLAEQVAGYALQPPEIGDNFVAILYKDPETGEAVSILIKITDDEMNKMVETYNAYDEKVLNATKKQEE